MPNCGQIIYNELVLVKQLTLTNILEIKGSN